MFFTFVPICTKQPRRESSDKCRTACGFLGTASDAAQKPRGCSLFCFFFMEKDCCECCLDRERMRKILIWSGWSKYLKDTDWPKYWLADWPKGKILPWCLHWAAGLWWGWSQCCQSIYKWRWRKRPKQPDPIVDTITSGPVEPSFLLILDIWNAKKHPRSVLAWELSFNINSPF